jgi:putative endonuclease
MTTVYLLHSEKLRRFYIGFTEDLELRLWFHEHAEGRKFTAKAKDWKLFLVIHCESRSQGLAIEQHIKRMKSSVYIQNLKRYPEMVEKLKIQYR